VRIEIILSPAVPWHLRETIGRCGFQLLRIGPAFRLRVGGVTLDPREVIVRIEPGRLKTTGAPEPATEDG
jgi:hypothetical protein